MANSANSAATNQVAIPARIATRRPSPARAACSVCMGALLTACAPDGEGASLSFVVRDSAGVAVAENRGAGEVTATWTVSPEPVLRLGTTEGGGPQQFTRVEVTRLSTGEIVVLELTASELRFFDSGGQHIRTVGGTGGGPGEFARATTFARSMQDTLLVQDVAGRAIHVFAPGGEFVRRIPADIFASRGWARTQFCPRLPLPPDGSFLACGAVEGGPPALLPAEVRTGLTPQILEIEWVPAETTTYASLRPFTFNSAYTITLPNGLLTSVVHPFQPHGLLEAGNDPVRLLLADRSDYSIEVWSHVGRLERVIRRLDADRLPTADESAAAFEELLGSADEMFHDLIRAEVTQPATIAAIHGLIAGPSGETWVLREPFLAAQTRTVFDVFDAEGRYLGEVILPAVVDVQEIGFDYLIGLTQDEFGIPFVEMYSLSRG